MMAFQMSTFDPFIDLDTPQYSQRYAWSGAFAGNLIGSLLGSCIFMGIPLVLGANPRFIMLDL